MGRGGEIYSHASPCTYMGTAIGTEWFDISPEVFQAFAESMPNQVSFYPTRESIVRY